MKLYVIYSITMMICPFLNATIMGPETVHFHPYFSTDLFSTSPFKIKSKALEITINHYFVDLQFTWEIESKSTTDLPFKASITTPQSSIVNRFRWLIDEQMVDASLIVSNHANDSFDIAQMNTAPVASLTEKKGGYTLSVFPVSKSNPQTVSINFLLPVTTVNRENFLALALAPIKGTPAKITIHQPDKTNTPSLSGDALQDFHEAETGTGLVLRGVEKANPKIKTLKMTWKTRPEHSLLIARKENDEWLYAIRAPMPELPLHYNSWTPKLSNEVVVFWSAPIDKGSHDFKDRIRAFKTLYWRSNRVLVVFVDDGMAKPFVAKSSRDESNPDLALSRLEAFEETDFSWKMPEDYLTNKHLCLLMEDDLESDSLPRIPDHVGAFFYPKMIFPNLASPFFNASVVWDYRKFNFTGSSGFYVFENNKMRRYKNYFQKALLVSSFSMIQPKVEQRAGTTQLLIFGKAHFRSSRSKEWEMPRTLLVTGLLGSLPEQFHFTFPGAGYSRIIKRENAQEIPAKILEKWMTQWSRLTLSKRSANLKSGSPNNVSLRAKEQRIGFLVFKNLESYRNHYVLPPDHFPSDKKALRQLESDSDQWPENFQKLNKEIFRDKANYGFVKFTPTFNGEKVPYLEFETIFALGASRPKETDFEGNIEPIRVKAGTYDIIARSWVLVKVPDVKVIAGETIEVPLPFKTEKAEVKIQE